MLRLSSIQVDGSLRETQQHGSRAFPLQTYLDDMDNYDRGCVPWHWHAELELGVMLKGSVQVTAGERQFSLHPGQGFFINSNVLHKQDPRQSGSQFFSILVSPTLLTGHTGSVFEGQVRPVLESPALDAVHLQPGVPWQGEMLECFTRVFALCEEQRPGYQLAATAQLLLAWQALYAANGHLLQSPAPAAPAKDDARQKQMLDFIHTNYAEPVTLEDIAASASLSTSECCRCFKRVLKTTPFAYLNQYRLGMAAHLMAQKGVNATRAGELAGFNSPSYFGKQFKAAFGCAPGHYARTQAGGLAQKKPGL